MSLKIKLLSLKNVIITFMRNSPLRLLLTAGVVAGLILGLYWILLEGFHFLNSLGGLGILLINKLFFIIFSILFFMVALSCGIIFFNISFRSRETGFYLGLPVSLERVGLDRFIEAGTLASWIPFFGSFLLIFSYCRAAQVPLAYSFLFLLYLVPFFVITTFLGCAGCLLAARFMNMKRAIIVSPLALVAVFLLFYLNRPSGLDKNYYFLLEEFGFLKFSKLWWTPFFWVCEGFMKLQENKFGQSFLFFTNILSLSCLCLAYFDFFVRRFFLSSFYRYSLGVTRKEYPAGALDILLSRIKLPLHFKIFLSKDIKNLTREPVWRLQFFIFFGILFFYFLNLRGFAYHTLNPVWKELIIFLNTFGILCIISSLGVRFLFPQWSIEAQNFRVLRLSSLTLSKIFLEKTLLGAVFFLPVSLALITISNIMLQAGPALSVLTTFTVLVSCISLVCISLGIGAYFFDPSQRSFLKSVETLGGFLALFLNLAYAILSVFSLFAIRFLDLSGRLPLPLNNAIIGYMIAWTVLSAGVSFSLASAGLRKLGRRDL